jgi:hypothetical protein
MYDITSNICEYGEAAVKKLFDRLYTLDKYVLESSNICLPVILAESKKLKLAIYFYSIFTPTAYLLSIVKDKTAASLYSPFENSISTSTLYLPANGQ